MMAKNTFKVISFQVFKGRWDKRSIVKANGERISATRDLILFTMVCNYKDKTSSSGHSGNIGLYSFTKVHIHWNKNRFVSREFTIHLIQLWVYTSKVHCPWCRVIYPDVKEITMDNLSFVQIKEKQKKKKC